MIKLLESYSNKKVILKEDDEFDLNPIFQPNERAKQELERRKKTLEPFIKNIKLRLREINKAFENREWKNEEEELFLESFYKSEVKVDLKEYPNKIFIIKDDKEIAFQDLKNKRFEIDYKSIWRIFEKQFHWDYGETKSFIKIMLNEYFKLRGYTPKRKYY